MSIGATRDSIEPVPTSSLAAPPDADPEREERDQEQGVHRPGGAVPAEVQRRAARALPSGSPPGRKPRGQVHAVKK